MNSAGFDTAPYWETGTLDTDRAPVGGGTPVLARLVDVLRRRKWIVSGCVLAMAILGLIVSLLMTPQYTASSVIEIQRESASMVDVEGSSPKGTLVDQEFYETQYGLLRSQTLSELVAKNLRLSDDPTFFEKMGATVPETWFPQGRPAMTAALQAERQRVAGQLLLRSFKLQPDRLSRLIRLSFTSPDAVLSQRVVNAWSQQFIQLTLERKFGATSYAREFLENRLGQLRNRIDGSERQLVDYASRESIVTLPGTRQENGQTSGDRSLLVDDLSTLNAELSRATADRVRAESRLGSAANASEALQSTALAGLRQRRAEVAADYARLMVQFEPNYPPARGLKSQLDQLDRSIATEVSRVGGSIDEVFQAARDRETRLRKQVNTLTQGVLDLRRRSIQYNILEREVDTNRQLYDALLQRYKAIGIAGGVGSNNILIVDEAKLPQRPSSPRLLLNLAGALMAGLGLGVVAAFVREQFDQGISDPAMVERVLAVPFLGTVPRSDGDVLSLLQDRKSAISESYLSLRTKLSFATDHGLPRSMAISSTRPGEGKSTTSLALAQSIARSGKRVLLIDADMRSPSQHALLSVPNDAGLSNILSGSATIAELVCATAFDNLYLIPGGPTPPSAPELIASGHFDETLTDALTQFDHVIFDAPPVMGLADSPLLGSKVEATVFVVEFSRTRRGMVQVAIDRLTGSRANLLGVVLTKFDVRRSSGGFDYDYGYSYRYGDTATVKQG